MFSDRPSRDKSLTKLLTEGAKERSHRDEMTAHRNFWETASMVQSHDGTPRATSLEARHKLCTNETAKSETVAARDWGEFNVSSSPTLHRTKLLTRNLRTLADEEYAGDHRWKCGGKEKAKNVWKGQSGARAIAKACEDRTLANLSFLEILSVKQETEVKHKKHVEQFLSFADEEKLALVADDEVDAAVVLYLNMSYSQGRPVSDGEVLLAGAPLLPTPVREVGRTETRSVVERSEGLEKTGSDTLKATVAENDLVWSLLGDGEKHETSDGHPFPDDDCDVLTAWRTLAVDVREPDQTNAWCGKRLVTAPPPSSTRRAEQNTKLRRHDRPKRPNLPLDHQSGCSLGGRPSLREYLRVPIRRFHERISESNTNTGTEGYRSVSVPQFWSVAGQSGTTPNNAGDQKNEEGGNRTTVLPGTKNLEDWHRSSAISPKVN